jgi:hypothetical protein
MPRGYCCGWSPVGPVSVSRLCDGRGEPWDRNLKVARQRPDTGLVSILKKRSTEVTQPVAVPLGVQARAILDRHGLEYVASGRFGWEDARNMGAGTLVMDLHQLAQCAAKKDVFIIIAPGSDLFGPEIVYARGSQLDERAAEA